MRWGRARSAASRTSSHGGDGWSLIGGRRSTETLDLASIFSSRCGGSTVMPITRSPNAPTRSPVVEGLGAMVISLCKRCWLAVSAGDRRSAQRVKFTPRW